jgi:hypothetical protein
MGAKYLVATTICERTADGDADAAKCINKNVYVFDRWVDKEILFDLALSALRRVQTKEWEIISEPEKWT